ncbi:MAG: hypothetical protein CMG75_02105 [Candidatus Marinimicrobia bacterium]|nr:hypothetical protein [Candidatus Neomarinimicrobiota bacterium]|tara:strand:- start:3909 stop:5192 length:1284 start_codon:yes stop_codon:yes gene_type:complete
MEKLFKMKKYAILFFAFIFFVANQSSAQKNKRNKMDVGAPLFAVSAPGYPTGNPDSTRLEVYVRVPYDAIQFVKKGDSFVSNYEVGITILDDKNNQLKQQIRTFEATTFEFNSTVSNREGDLSVQSFILSPNKYVCVVEVTDKDTRKTGTRKINIDLRKMGKNTSISDLLLLDPKIRANTHPYGLPIIPARTIEKDSILNVYYELKVPMGTKNYYVRLLSVEDKILFQDTLEIQGDNTLIKKILTQDISGISASRFKLEISLDSDIGRISSEIIVRNLWIGLTAFVNNIDEAINQLRYIAYSDEVKKLEKSKPDKKEENFMEFWSKRDPTPETQKNELMDEYYRRIQYTNEKFGTWQAGWKTAMGMIFILFGPPDDIEVNMYARDGRNYQRWTYFKINRSFTFVDYNGFGEYEFLDPYVSSLGTRVR